jgi:hypothetical protein
MFKLKLYFSNSLFLLVFFQIENAVANVTYTSREEASLVSCNFVARSSKPFKQDYKDAAAAITTEWMSAPSKDFDFNKFLSQPTLFEYRGAYCENALQLLILKTLEAPSNNKVIESRCNHLIASRIFMNEVKTGKNSYLESRDNRFPLPDAFMYWNDKDRKNIRLANPPIDIACQSFSEKEKAVNLPVSNITGKVLTDYSQALKELIVRCEVLKRTATKGPHDI